MSTQDQVILAEFRARLGAEWSVTLQGPRLVAFHRSGTHLHRLSLPSLADGVDELERDIIDAEATWRLLLPALTSAAPGLVWLPGWVHRAIGAPHITGPTAHGQTPEGHALTARIVAASLSGYRVEVKHLDLCASCLGDGATLASACVGVMNVLRSHLAHVRRRVFTVEDVL